MTSAYRANPIPNILTGLRLVAGVIFLIGLVCYLYSFRQRGRVPVAAAAAAAA